MLPEFAVELLNKEFRGRTIIFDPHDWFGGSRLGIGISWIERDSVNSSVILKITPAQELPGDEITLRLEDIRSGVLLGQSPVRKIMVHHEHGGKTFAYSAKFEPVPTEAVCMLQAELTD